MKNSISRWKTQQRNFLPAIIVICFFISSPFSADSSPYTRCVYPHVNTCKGKKMESPGGWRDHDNNISTAAVFQRALRDSLPTPPARDFYLLLAPEKPEKLLPVVVGHKRPIKTTPGLWERVNFYLILFLTFLCCVGEVCNVSVNSFTIFFLLCFE